MPRPSKARKVDEAQRERLVEHLSGIPPADAAIMAAGALAGTKGYTPMTMLIKGLTSGGNGLANDALNVVDNIMNNKWVQMTPAGMVYDYNVRIPRLLSDVILGPPADRPTHNTYSPGYVPPVTGGQYSVTPIASKVDWDHYYKLAALASVGMVEAYMITRPGAFGAVLNMIQTGVSGIAGAAKVGAALLG